MPENGMFIGPFSKALRIELELTQKDVSDATGYSIQTVSKFENGHSNPYAYASREIYSYLSAVAMQCGHDVDDEFSNFCQNMRERIPCRTFVEFQQ